MEEVTARDLQHVVTSARDSLTLMLTSGDIDPTKAAILRRKYEILQAEWTNDRKTVMMLFGGLVVSKQESVEAWAALAVKNAVNEVAYERVPGVAYRLTELTADYLFYVNQVLNNFQKEFDKILVVVDEYDGIRTEYTGNLDGPRLARILVDAFMEWFRQHHIDEDFLQTLPQKAMKEFLRERRDMVALYNFIFELPRRKSVTEVDIERPLVVEAVELAIGFIPIVGNAIALYEAGTGRDIFGYRLTNLERGILAASCLLPAAGRMVKGGRALYTNTRLVKLYGKDAATWNRAVQQSARALEQRAALGAIKSADDVLKATGKLEGKIAQEAAEALPKVLRPSSAVLKEVEKEIVVAWEALSKRFRPLADLDELAIRRVVEKGTNVDHIKGQLLEELLEAYILPLLRNRKTAFALGIQLPKGAALEFIPGHLIRTSSGKAGRQITDGMLGYYSEGVFNIVGIFEAKAGRSGARELSFTKSKIADLTKAEREELRAFAGDVWREEKEIADAAGKSYGKTIETIEKEVILDETGGQLARDIERLDHLADGTLMDLRFGGNVTPVKILSATMTKFFAIVPKGVTKALIEKEVKALGFLIETIAVPIHTKDLGKIAKELAELAQRVAP